MPWTLLDSRNDIVQFGGPCETRNYSLLERHHKLLQQSYKEHPGRFAIMNDDEFATLRDLMILLLLKSGVSYEAIAKVTQSNVKTLQNTFPLKTINRKRENV